uniref:Uncharacterized protein n=1 Tax=Hemiselmis andersenii TaxID=464988 RepID=A0A6U4ZUA0_HEMAN|mmetsp:Transcript_25292/g.58604  ORF Transcript_25292/g.58604 Transcript_25292/m.58604 type:complete len:471 (+) Transcript_25292:183-1595(+)
MSGARGTLLSITASIVVMTFVSLLVANKSTVPYSESVWRVSHSVSALNRTVNDGAVEGNAFVKSRQSHKTGEQKTVKDRQSSNNSSRRVTVANAQQEGPKWWSNIYSDGEGATITSVKLITPRNPHCFQRGSILGSRHTTTRSWSLCAWRNGDIHSNNRRCALVHLNATEKTISGDFLWERDESGKYEVHLTQFYNRHDDWDNMVNNLEYLGTPKCLRDLWNYTVTCKWAITVGSGESPPLIVGSTNPRIPHPESFVGIKNLVFIGDSTMKRLYDNWRFRCTSSQLDKVGKLHQDHLSHCGNLSMHYIASVELHRTDEAIANMTEDSASTMLIFNTGHNYVLRRPLTSQNGKDSLDVVVTRIKEALLRRQLKIAVYVASPPFFPEKHKQDFTCLRSPHIAERANEITLNKLCGTVACARFFYFRALAMSSDAIDFVHFAPDGNVVGYQTIIDEILVVADKWHWRGTRGLR